MGKSKCFNTARSKKNFNRFLTNKSFCFLCKYEIRSKFRKIIFNGTPKKCCMQCNSVKHKALLKIYNSKMADLQCSVCDKTVTGHCSIYCSNCNHFVHGKCNNLTKQDIATIDRTIQQNWSCESCTLSIFPTIIITNTISGSTLPLEDSHLTNFKQCRNCYFCNCQICTDLTTDKIFMESNSPLYTCDHCFMHNIDSIEFISCNLCTKNVYYESVLCELCRHWIHASCLHLSTDELKLISNYENWFCPTCCNDIFPLYKSLPTVDYKMSLCNESSVKSADYKTFSDCSGCSKKVTSKRSINCNNCRHWVHQKCIPGLDNNTDFNDFLAYYSDKEWICNKCNKHMFPFADLDASDLQLLTLTNARLSFANANGMNNISNTYKRLIENEQVNNKWFCNVYDENANECNDKNQEINVSNILPISDNCEYVFDLKTINNDNNRSTLSILNFNIRSIKSNFLAFRDGLLSPNDILSQISLLLQKHGQTLILISKTLP